MFGWLVVLTTTAHAEDANVLNTLVIDVSGSMADSRVGRLTENVLDTWQGWRSVGLASPGDRLGAVAFADQATELLAPARPDGLNGVLLEPLTFGGRATLEGVLPFADTLGDAPSHHMVILTDGGIADGPLPAVPKGVVVHAVATGEVFPLEGARLRALSARTGGSFLQAGSDAEFDVGATVALQQSLQGNTWHVAAIVADATATVDVPGTANAVSLMAFGESGTTVELRAQPPGSDADELVGRGSDGSARIDVSASQQYLGGAWTLTTDPPGSVTAMVMVDNTALRSDLVIAADAICAGEEIAIDVFLDAFGDPVPDEDFTMIVEVREPTAGVGDLLSDGAREPDASGEDPPSKGQSLLDQRLAEAPAPGVGPVRLAWDSTGSGVYTALYTPPVAGHYRVDVTIEGPSGQSGAFAFHHRESFYATVCPDESGTTVGFDAGQLQVIPAWAADARERLGPGYEGRLWVDIEGRESVLLVDQFDGSYVAEVSEADLPRLSVRYVSPLLPPDDVTGATPLGTVDDDVTVDEDAADDERVCGGCQTRASPGLLGLALLLPWGLARRRRAIAGR